MSRTVTLCLQFLIVTTTLWGQLAGKTMTVQPRSLLLYRTVMLSWSIKPLHSSALWMQCKSKNTTHLPGHGYPRPAQGLG